MRIIAKCFFSRLFAYSPYIINIYLYIYVYTHTPYIYRSHQTEGKLNTKICTHIYIYFLCSVRIASPLRQLIHTYVCTKCERTAFDGKKTTALREKCTRAIIFCIHRIHSTRISSEIRCSPIGTRPNCNANGSTSRRGKSPEFPPFQSSPACGKSNASTF